MATTAAPAPEGPAKSALGRITGTFFSPRETFTDIARRPSWLVPLALLTVVGLAFALVMNQRVDWPNFLRQQIESNPRTEQMTPEQKERIVEQQSKWSPAIAYVIGGLGPTFSALVLGLIYWGAFNMFAGANMKFGQSFGIAAHAQLPGLLSGPLGILVMYLKDYGDVDPERIVATNVGVLLASDTPKWMRSVGSSLDIFWFWEIFLLGTGFSMVNPKKISMGKALGTIIGIWAVWVLAKAGMAAVFS